MAIAAVPGVAEDYCTVYHNDRAEEDEAATNSKERGAQKTEREAAIEREAVTKATEEGAAMEPAEGSETQSTDNGPTLLDEETEIEQENADRSCQSPPPFPSGSKKRARSLLHNNNPSRSHKYSRNADVLSLVSNRNAHVVLNLHRQPTFVIPAAKTPWKMHKQCLSWGL